jgi:hypothetical protein
MQGPAFFDPIRIEIPAGDILRRLGFRRRLTRLPADQKKLVADHVREAAGLIALKGIGLILPITANDGRRVGLEGGAGFESASLAGLLKGCPQALLMGATAGGSIMEAIATASRDGEMTRAVVFDAVASEMTDAALGWLMAYHAGTLRRQGSRLTARRYSAGYGDFALENQRTFYRLLGLERIGVTLTESCILMPEKSVTAICGVVAAAEAEL